MVNKTNVLFFFIIRHKSEFIHYINLIKIKYRLQCKNQHTVYNNRNQHSCKILNC